MLHACVERFDVMGGRGNILGWDGEVNKAYVNLLGRYQARRVGVATDHLAYSLFIMKNKINRSANIAFSYMTIVIVRDLQIFNSCAY
jgi:hypothetical protein